MTDSDIMTLEEVAAYLKLKPQTIYTWAQEKRIPAAKLGKEWRFKKSIIDRWINQHFDPKFQPIMNDAEGGGSPPPRVHKEPAPAGPKRPRSRK